MALVDDDLGVLSSLEALLTTDGYRVKTFASPGAFLTRLPELSISCLVTDLKMAEFDGIELVRRIGPARPFSVIMISGHADVSHAVAAMQAGVADFLTKPFAPRRLLEAIAAAIASDATRREPAGGRPGERRSGYELLSPREHQVVELLIAGHTSRTAGAALGISPKTVDVFRGNIFRKMEVANIAALSTAVAAARRRRRD